MTLTTLPGSPGAPALADPWLSRLPRNTALLVGDEWRRITYAVTGDLKFQREFGNSADTVQRHYAGRLLDAALEHLRYVASKPIGEALPCPAIVDIALDILILFTPTYRRVCNLLAGRYIDHVPFDTEMGESSPYTAQDVADDMRAGGFIVDPLFYTGPMAWCSPDGPDEVPGCRNH